MTNAEKTRKFLEVIDAKTRAAILQNIAECCGFGGGITPTQAFDEVTADDAEHLLDYLTGPTRLATSVLMQRHGLK